VREATRDGAPPIDLVDGSELADKLKETDLGIRKELAEVVIVEEDWFDGL
jgi:restriction system protein